MREIKSSTTFKYVVYVVYDENLEKNVKNSALVTVKKFSAMPFYICDWKFFLEESKYLMNQLFD